MREGRKYAGGEGLVATQQHREANLLSLAGIAVSPVNVLEREHRGGGRSGGHPREKEKIERNRERERESDIEKREEGADERAKERHREIQRNKGEKGEKGGKRGEKKQRTPTYVSSGAAITDE